MGCGRLTQISAGPPVRYAQAATARINSESPRMRKGIADSVHHFARKIRFEEANLRKAFARRSKVTGAIQGPWFRGCFSRCDAVILLTGNPLKRRFYPAAQEIGPQSHEGMPDGDGGTHRVMAGDATDRAQVERLMN